MRGEFGCNRILARFLEQDLKFDSFGNLGLIYTLVYTLSGFPHRTVLCMNLLERNCIVILSSYYSFYSTVLCFHM